MKKIICGLTMAVLVVGLVGYATVRPAKSEAEKGLAVQSAPGPTVVVATPMVKMSKKAEVVIMGTGFEPSQKIRLLFTTTDGVHADIEYALKPRPVANKIGAWVTTWSCGPFVAKKLIKEEVYVIIATDAEYNLLGHAPVVFYAEKKPEEKPKKK